MDRTLYETLLNAPGQSGANTPHYEVFMRSQMPEIPVMPPGQEPPPPDYTQPPPGYDPVTGAMASIAGLPPGVQLPQVPAVEQQAPTWGQQAAANPLLMAGLSIMQHNGNIGAAGLGLRQAAGQQNVIDQIGKRNAQQKFDNEMSLARVRAEEAKARALGGQQAFANNLAEQRLKLQQDAAAMEQGAHSFGMQNRESQIEALTQITGDRGDAAYLVDKAPAIGAQMLTRGNQPATNEDIDKMRSQFEALPEVKKYRAGLGMFGALENTLAQTDNPLTAVTAVIQLIKSLDPSSTVTVNEMGLMTGASGPWAQFQAAINKTVGQGALTTQARANILRAARAGLVGQHQTAKEAQDQYGRLAGKRGILDIRDVVGESFSTPEEVPAFSSGPAGTAPGPEGPLDKGRFDFSRRNSSEQSGGGF